DGRSGPGPAHECAPLFRPVRGERREAGDRRAGAVGARALRGPGPRPLLRADDVPHAGAAHPRRPHLGQLLRLPAADGLRLVLLHAGLQRRQLHADRLAAGRSLGHLRHALPGPGGDGDPDRPPAPPLARAGGCGGSRSPPPAAGGARQPPPLPGRLFSPPLSPSPSPRPRPPLPPLLAPPPPPRLDLLLNRSVTAVELLTVLWYS